MKSVCIVGAGPAGLVAAKTLLQTGGYHISIYEAAERVGGMWRGRRGQYGDKCSPEMRTNLSRFTVAFSDLAWSSVDSWQTNSGVALNTKPPMFPKAWQVGQYLEAYARKFGVDANVEYNTRVTKAKILGNLEQWEITCVNSATKQTSLHTFDYLIVASGFFGQPMSSFDPSPTGQSTSIMHSSKFREVSALTEKPGKIVVIGGGISGSEAAAQAASQISSARHSPGKTKPAHSGSTIYHVVNRPFYCLPRYLPQEPSLPDGNPNPAPDFLPLDLAMYNLSRRGKGEISASINTVPPDKTMKGHEFMRSVIGGDQNTIGRPELVYTPEQTQHPGYTGITDTYMEFVRSGLIVPVQGWAEKVQAGANDSGFSITVNSRQPWASPDSHEGITITEVTGIVEATGYETSLGYLDESVKELLDYDPTCPRIPFLLSRGSVFAKAIPTIAFVGFYEGPYWGVMEMQARLVADTWSENSTRKRDEYHHHQIEAEQMRIAIRTKSLQVPQFWMMDYVGIIEEFARLTNTTRNDSSFGGQTGPAFPSRYTRSSTKDESAAAAFKEVTDIIQAPPHSAQFVAPAVFRGLQGSWLLSRRIASRTSTPGGTFSGTAHFHPRTPAAPSYAAEYLYIEEGTFAMDTGLCFPASRRYIYRYNETSDKITSWFAAEDNESTGALFNTWDIYHPSVEGFEGGWRARGLHWCDPDTYKNDCEFTFRGAALERFGITFEVSGPSKDYSHKSWFERPVAEYK
ncbi:hypothetical protein CC86DRAFT_82469 [Ophiobolus disseminans]|uniref:Uncharacterized protein n=1 Tax=Ophiobolus disseminans TaxID=1469910 RepID=A0A6A7AEX9_9PLEO|nr:hypothetical protein CC86DRAFT_82469 [Ophiobolus disseminans]